MEGGVVNVLELKPGERGQVCKVLPKFFLGGGHRHCWYRYCWYCQGKERSRGGGKAGGGVGGLFEGLGVFPGQVVEVLENRGRGPVILKVGHIRCVLGRDLASRILVERL